MVATSQAGTAPGHGKESVLSPVLLIVLAGLWAAVLIPATLRSRDHAHDGRTMDGFHTAMRTLSRRTTPTDSRRILIPPASLTSAAVTFPGVARRRSVFLRAAWAAAGALLLAIAFGGWFLWLLQIGTDLALVGVVGWLRRISVAEAQEARRVRRAMHAERLRREAAQVAAFAARRSRPAYDELAHRRAVND
ncbi:MAG TPA: hypothetical protein VNA14_05995 [Mycobacteriales bacterium]|nr:hypothetical protein [Mycobacteriales bacterium]